MLDNQFYILTHADSHCLRVPSAKIFCKAASPACCQFKPLLCKNARNAPDFSGIWRSLLSSIEAWAALSICSMIDVADTANWLCRGLSRSVDTINPSVGSKPCISSAVKFLICEVFEIFQNCDHAYSSSQTRIIIAFSRPLLCRYKMDRLSSVVFISKSANKMSNTTYCGGKIFDSIRSTTPNDLTQSAGILTSDLPSSRPSPWDRNIPSSQFCKIAVVASMPTSPCWSAFTDNVLVADTLAKVTLVKPSPFLN